MEEERLIATRIINELLNFYIVRLAKNIHIDLTYKENGAYITIKGQVEVDEEELKEFSQALSQPRNPSLENNIEELVGTSHHELSDYQMIGLLIDDVDVHFHEKSLTVECFRKNLLLQPSHRLHLLRKS